MPPTALCEQKEPKIDDPPPFYLLPRRRTTAGLPFIYVQSPSLLYPRTVDRKSVMYCTLCDVTVRLLRVFCVDFVKT